jgi:hypothetical protein
MLVALKRKLLRIMDNDKRRAVRMFYVSTVDCRKGNRGRMRGRMCGVFTVEGAVGALVGLSMF